MDAVLLWTEPKMPRTGKMRNWNESSGRICAGNGGNLGANGSERHSGEWRSRSTPAHPANAPGLRRGTESAGMIKQLGGRTPTLVGAGAGWARGLVGPPRGLGGGDNAEG